MLRSAILRPVIPVALLLVGSLLAQGATAGVAPDPAGATPVQPPAAASVPSSLDVRKLGIAEAALDYCAKNDPTGGAKVRARLKQLVQGTDREALAKARKSDEYQRAHDSEADFISKIDPHNAHRLCSGTAGPKQVSK